jgi:hypothetical protein
MSVNGSYGALSSVIITGAGSGSPWYIGPSLYNPRCDWNPLAGGCGGGGSHGQLTQVVGTTCYGAVGNYDPTVSLSGSSITGPTPITGATCITNGVTYTFNQGYAGGNGYTSNPYLGGGGGGAGGIGGNANPIIVGTSGIPGNGGNGITNTINSSTTTYACGGGGSTRNWPNYPTDSSYISQGGSSSVNGGRGYSFQSDIYIPNATKPNQDGFNGTGTGGGAWGQYGQGNAGRAGSGGNGIAIIRYPRVVNIT